MSYTTESISDTGIKYEPHSVNAEEVFTSI